MATPIESHRSFSGRRGGSLSISQSHSQQQMMNSQLELSQTRNENVYFAGKPSSIPWTSNSAAVKQAYDPASWNYKEGYLGSKFGG
jgi:hypothetical protein